MAVIYRLHNNINKKNYIGQTLDYEERMKGHKSGPTCKDKMDQPLYLDIKKYGWENFTKEILFESEDQEIIDEKERYYIKEFKSLLTENGYNSMTGGKTHFNHSNLTKEKIALAQIGDKNHMYGKFGGDNPAARRVINLTTNKIYDSIKECAGDSGINPESIYKVTAVCRGRRGSTNGQIFRYLDENGNVIEPELNAKKKTKRVLNIDTGEIFNSVRDADKKYGKIGNNNIGKVCSGKEEKAYGFRWKFVD